MTEPLDILQNARKRLVVTGTRRGHPHVIDVLDGWLRRHGYPDMVILGDADGVDAMALDWAHKRGFKGVTFQHIAEWDRLGDAAGPKRNAAMVAHAGPGAHLVAFPDERSKGTWNCVQQASAAGLHVYVVPMVSP